MKRRLSVASSMLAAAWLAMGCGSITSRSTADDGGVGQLGLPLKTYSASGVEYRLRDAEFQVWGYPQDCWLGGNCEFYEQNFNSDDHLEDDSIVLDLIAGEYEIFLSSGWQLEKVEDGGSEIVEATLLNDPYQWIWLQPHSTSWVSYQFGVGDAEIWLNGQLNVNIQVYEDPDEYYWPGAAGANSGAGGAGGMYSGAGGALFFSDVAGNTGL